MNRSGRQLLPRAALAGDQYRRPGVFQPGNHAQDILDIRGTADDAVEVFLRCYPFA